MRKVCFATVAVLLAMAFVPTAPAQVPQQAVAQVIALACQTGLDDTVFPVVSTGVSGTHTGTSSYNAPSGNANVHRFDFCGAAGDAAYFYVDNVDTPSDVWACLVPTPTSPCVPSFYNSILTDLGGDDELPCTVPHTYACPAGDAALPADANGDGVYHLRVGSWSAVGGYDGYVKLNGADVPVVRAL